MSEKEMRRKKLFDKKYEKPEVDIFMLSSNDVVSTSGPGEDGNQGEWDPQSYSVYPNY